MTTEHMHHEHDDANEAIVINASVPESTAEVNASDTTPTEEPGTNTISEPIAPLTSPAAQDEAQESSSILSTHPTTAPIAEVEQHPASSEQEHEQQTQETTSAEPATTQIADQPAAFTAGEPAQTATPSSAEEEMPFVASNDEEVRPFTAFIEEFRQAE